MNLNELKQKLNVLVDPSNGFTIGETNSIKHVSYDEEKDIVILTIAMGRLGGENEKNFRRSIAKVVKVDCGYKGLQRQWDDSKVFGCTTQTRNHMIEVISGKAVVEKSRCEAKIERRRDKR